MKLKLGNSFRLSWLIWGALGAVLIFFLVRVGLWENQYYRDKEGSARIAPINNLEEGIVDETPITEEQVKEYTVAPDRPRYLSVARLGIKNARILPIGLAKSGALGTPNNIYDVAWYYNSAKPGTGGTAVLDGHSGGPRENGIFRHLNSLQVDDIVTIELGSGTILNYRVVENNAIPLEDANAYMSTAFKSPLQDTESITIISCSGTWSKTLGTYDHRQFVRAVLDK